MSSELQASLQAALREGYRIERELTRGGMSRVFLAIETGLGRTVVLKILPPDLVAGLSAERFHREIQVAARLQHPHIVPLLSAGQAGDFLYYTMPLVEGESLRALLERQGELPVASAIRVATEVARALAYAHRHGIVHRDIKPDNILLAGDEAQVADFGIAKAVSLSAEKGELTSVGLALGTPMYMAPEQGAADPATDHRADLYALGVVLYEMLAGQPPFGGRTPQQILGAHATETPVPVRTRRPAVPESVADVVHRLLEKRAADRPQNAEEVIRLLDAAAASSHATTPSAMDRPQPARRGRWLVAGGVATLALVVTIAALTDRRRPATVDQSVVAIAPFRVSGADSSLGYLREGMVDLLAAKLSGSSGLRAADPRSLLSGWRRAAGGSGDLPASDAAGIAARVGAGRLIQGDVVGTRQHITINATVLDAPGARVRARASVEGSPDSLPRLVDALAAKLLALEAGEGEQRLANLTSTSLPALRAYLDGQALVRGGSFQEAAARFKVALELDSTFALAGLGLSRAGQWFGQGTQGPGSVVAWRYRDKLSLRDRALLDVYLGPRWPAPSPFVEQIQMVERFVRLTPDNPEAWYELGDYLYHWAPLTGIPDAHRRAAAAFARAIALDSSFTLALEHGVTLALSLEDTAGAINALRRKLRVDSTSPWAAGQRWELAMALGDTAGRRAALQSDSLTFLAPLLQLPAIALGLPLQDMDSLFRNPRARAATAEEQARIDNGWHLNSIIMGQPSRAVPWSASDPEQVRLSSVFLEARFADGDSAAGAAAGFALDRTIGTPLIPGRGTLVARYAAGQRALDLGRLDRAQQAVADLYQPRIPADSGWLAETSKAYALILDAQLAARRQSPEQTRLLNQLDSAMTNTSSLAAPSFGNLVLARLYENQGNLAGALAALRRRVFDYPVYPIYVTYHREEGRLAALNGERAGAIRSYRRYLALRSAAEPRLQPQVARVRADLEALERESTDR